MLCTMQLTFGAGTDPGRVRTKNEDRYVANATLRFFAAIKPWNERSEPNYRHQEPSTYRQSLEIVA